VTIAANQTLTRGEILCRALSTSVTAGGSNSGNGTLTVSAIGLMVVEGAYTAVCTSTSSNGGIFELCCPDGSAVAFASVGVPLVCDDLALTIADGSSDFAVGDTFAITVTGGSYAAYNFAGGLSSPPQFSPSIRRRADQRHRNSPQLKDRQYSMAPRFTSFDTLALRSVAGGTTMRFSRASPSSSSEASFCGAVLILSAKQRHDEIGKRADSPDGGKRRRPTTLSASRRRASTSSRSGARSA